MARRSMLFPKIMRLRRHYSLYRARVGGNRVKRGGVGGVISPPAHPLLAHVSYHPPVTRSGCASPRLSYDPARSHHTYLAHRLYMRLSGTISNALLMRLSGVARFAVSTSTHHRTRQKKSTIPFGIVLFLPYPVMASTSLGGLPCLRRRRRLDAEGQGL